MKSITLILAGGIQVACLLYWIFSGDWQGFEFWSQILFSLLIVISAATFFGSVWKYYRIDRLFLISIIQTFCLMVIVWFSTLGLEAIVIGLVFVIAFLIYIGTSFGVLVFALKSFRDKFNTNTVH